MFEIPEELLPAADLADRLSLVAAYLRERAVLAAEDNSPSVAGFLREDAAHVDEAIRFLDSLHEHGRRQ